MLWRIWDKRDGGQMERPIRKLLNNLLLIIAMEAFKNVLDAFTIEFPNNGKHSNILYHFADNH